MALSELNDKEKLRSAYRNCELSIQRYESCKSHMELCIDKLESTEDFDTQSTADEKTRYTNYKTEIS